MKQYIDLLLACPLFGHIEARGLESMLHCMGARKESFQRGQYILSAGDYISSAGVVLSGSAHIMRDDFWGNHTILSDVLPGETFGELHALAHEEPLSFSVAAAEPAEVLFLDVGHVLRPCASVCTYHVQLISNFLAVMARKNITLTRKIDHISRRTTRQKLLAYLSHHAARSESASFEIPFNRQQLADYLAVDRSAMSLELSRMKRDGLVDFSRNHFTLFLPHDTHG